MMYTLPEAMLPEVKGEYTKLCNKGQVLYETACSHCHNSGTKRRPVIPDFSQQQLTGYALRVSNRQHERNMPDSLVTEEELNTIVIFLTYKNKNKTKAK